jgi:ketosteroid isomerase-like protein
MLGKDKAVKFSVRPCEGQEFVSPAGETNADYLSENLAAHLRERSACFDFMVQARMDPRTMPIEDPTIEWREDEAPFVTVARLTIAPQTPDVGEFCESTSFTPWHSLPEHQPLGGINRARKAVYQVVSRLRHDFNQQKRAEPTVSATNTGNIKMRSETSSSDSASQNKKTLESFYDAFARRDAKAMADLYHPEATFEDPIFGKLNHAQVVKMWTLLLNGAKDLRLTYSDVKTGDATGTLTWVADYTYRPGLGIKNAVHNVVHASFEFKDGLILRHHDDFNLSSWIKMAFKPVGLILGSTSWFQNIVKSKARERLDE